MSLLKKVQLNYPETLVQECIQAYCTLCQLRLHYTITVVELSDRPLSQKSQPAVTLLDIKCPYSF